MSPGDSDSLTSEPARQFATTQWSLIVAAQDRSSPQAQEAIATLCQVYWYPLYAFIRRQGHSPDSAQDHTQEFFARLLEKDLLGAADRAKGRFRAYLLAACKNFLANERDRTNALKRGGGRTTLSLDFREAENRYGLEPAYATTPETLYERRWALTLLDYVLGRLRDENVRNQKSKHFELLKSFLTDRKGVASYAQVAATLEMTEGAVKVAVHRLRKRYGELLREEIARTVDGPEEVDEEIHNLFRALASQKDSKSL